jgi:hypothetical protein
VNINTCVLEAEMWKEAEGCNGLCGGILHVTLIMIEYKEQLQLDISNLAHIDAIHSIKQQQTIGHENAAVIGNIM